MPLTALTEEFVIGNSGSFSERAVTVPVFVLQCPGTPALDVNCKVREPAIVEAVDTRLFPSSAAVGPAPIADLMRLMGIDHLAH